MKWSSGQRERERERGARGGNKRKGLLSFLLDSFVFIVSHMSDFLRVLDWIGSMIKEKISNELKLSIAYDRKLFLFSTRGLYVSCHYFISLHKIVCPR